MANGNFFEQLEQQEEAPEGADFFAQLEQQVAEEDARAAQTPQTPAPNFFEQLERDVAAEDERAQRLDAPRSAPSAAPLPEEGVSLGDQVRAGFKELEAGIRQFVSNEALKAAERVRQFYGPFRPPAARQNIGTMLDVAGRQGIEAAQLRGEAAQVPVSEDLKRIAEGTAGEAVRGIIDRPGVLLEAGARSLPNSLPSMVMGIVGAAIAPPVAIGGALAGGFGAEFTGELEQRMRDEGLDPNDPQQLWRALQVDPDALDRAYSKAARKASGVAIADAAGIKLGSKVLSPAFKSKFLTESVNVLGQVVGQSLLEAGGEAAGQALAGDELKGGEIVLEGAVGGVMGAPAEIVAGRFAGRDKDKKSIEDRIRERLRELEEEDREGRAIQGEGQTLDEAVKPTVSEKIEAGSPLTELEARKAYDTWAQLELEDIARQEVVDSLVGDLITEEVQGLDIGSHTRSADFTSKSIPDDEWANIDPERFRTILGASQMRPEQRDRLLGLLDTAMPQVVLRELQNLVASNPQEPGALNVMEQLAFPAQFGWDRGQVKTFDLQFGARNQEEIGALQAALSLAKTLVKDFAPNIRLGLKGGTRFHRLGGPGPTAVASAGYDFRQGRDRYYIALDLERLRSAAESSRIPLRSFMLETMAHEFGHVVSFSEYRKASPEAKKAVLNAYREWLADVDSLSLKDFWTLRSGPLTRMALKETDPFLAPNYWFNFNEFFAESFSRKLAQDIETIDPDFDAVLEEGLSELKNIYRFVRTRSPLSKKIYPAFDTFVESLRNRSVMETLAGEENTTALVTEDPVLANEVAEKLEARLNLPSGHGIPNAVRAVPRWNTFVKWSLFLPQIERENRGIPGVSRFVQAVRQWWEDRGIWVKRAQETLAFAREVKVEQRKEDLKAFEKFVIGVTLESGKKGRKLNQVELSALQQQHGLTQGGEQLWGRMQGDFLDALRELFEVLRVQAQATIADPAALQKKLAEIDVDQRRLENHDYFPLQRYGRHMVTVRARTPTAWQGIQYAPGDVVYFSLFENPKEADVEAAALNKRFSGQEIKVGLMSDEQFAMQGMPPSLLETIKEITLKEALAVNPQANISALRNSLDTSIELALLDASPASAFKKRLQKRMGTPGFSYDALRSYADYFRNYAGFISRIKNTEEMQDSLRELADYADQRGRVAPGDDLKEIRRRRRENEKLVQMRDGLAEHMDYLMNPSREFAGARSFVANWFLGFVPRVALVNLTQTMLATYPKLAQDFSDVSAVAEMRRAYSDLPRMWSKGRGNFSPDLVRAIERGFRAGFLDEGLATELGAYADGEALGRMNPGVVQSSRALSHRLRQFQQAAFWMQRLSEKTNRLVSFKAAYMLRRNELLAGRDFGSLAAGQQQDIEDTSFAYGREVVELTQGEFARWARPKIMQGRASVFFLFKSYPQLMSYFVLRAGKGATGRFILMSLLLGGALGLPFAGNLMDLVKAILKQWSPNKRIDPVKELKEEMNEIGQALDVAPDLLLHGGARYGFGALYPFDLSAAVSLGQIVPGTSVVARESGALSSAEATIGRTVEELAGPIGALATNAYRAVASDEMDDWKRWERTLPAVAQNISKATRRFVREEETGPKLEPILEYDPQNTDHMVELVGQVAGLQSRRLATERVVRWEQLQSERFYKARRTRLLRNYFEALDSQDRDAEADAWKAITRYNVEVPDFALGISTQELRRSIGQRLIGQEKSALGLPDSAKYYGIFEEIRQAFDHSVVEEPSP